VYVVPVSWLTSVSDRDRTPLNPPQTPPGLRLPRRGPWSPYGTYRGHSSQLLV